jgi:HPt (histidine-containing phosphotransfer) domain-containing protein
MKNEELPLDISKLKIFLWGEQDIFIQIAQAMRDDIDVRGARLHQAYLAGDAVTVKQEAHALKGGLASVTALTAAGLAADLERMATADQWNGFDVKLTLFNAELKRVDKQLQQELAMLKK